MNELLEWITDEIQNWTFRIEDIILHSFTGVITAILVKFKSLFRTIKKLINKQLYD